VQTDGFKFSDQVTGGVALCWSSLRIGSPISTRITYSITGTVVWSTVYYLCRSCARLCHWALVYCIFPLYLKFRICGSDVACTPVCSTVSIVSKNGHSDFALAHCIVVHPTVLHYVSLNRSCCVTAHPPHRRAHSRQPPRTITNRCIW
jgi:hypothetical protein